MPKTTRRKTDSSLDVNPSLDLTFISKLQRVVSSPHANTAREMSTKEEVAESFPPVRLRFSDGTPKRIESSPRFAHSRKRRGSYSGDPLQPNLIPRDLDPVHAKNSRVSKARSVEKLKIDMVYHENSENEDSDASYEIEIPATTSSQFSHDAPLLTSRLTQWIHISCKGESPSERIYHDSAVIGKRLFVTFGTDGETVMNQIYALDLATYTWQKPSPKGKLPAHRYGHTCTALGKQLLIFGGRDKMFVLSDMYVYHTRENRWHRIRVEPPMPGRAYHKAHLYKDHIFFIGGIDCTGKTVSKTIKFHIPSKTWKLISITGFKGRARFAMADLGEGKLALIGGCKSNKSLFNASGKFVRDMLIIDIVFETTIVREKISPMLRLVNATASAYDCNIIVFGGYTKRKQATGDLKVMSVKENMWSAEIAKVKGTKPTDLEGHSANLFRHGLIIFGGQTQEKGLSNECYLLRIGGMRADVPSSIDLFDTLVQPIRKKFQKKAKKVPVINFNEITDAVPLAQGATGTVSKAIWNNCYVVLKEFRRDEQLFQAELNILAGLSHPNIVKCHGIITEPSRYIVLEYVPLGDLFTFCQKQQEPIGWQLIFAFSIGIAKGMAHLHSNSILHRDLKSLNVLVQSTNPKKAVCTKLVDFGDSREAFRYHERNELCGTVRWTAPEVFSKAPFTPKSDVFSFGIILWEMVALEIPYSEFKRDYQVQDYVEEGGRPSILEDCPVGYRTLMQSCWNQKAQDRPTFEQILQVLNEMKTRSSWDSSFS